MLPIVRDLYKRILMAGREYPKGLSWVREKAKTAFFEKRQLTDEEELIWQGEYNINKDDLIDNIYSSTKPNEFIASFASILHQLKEETRVDILSKICSLFVT